MIKNNKQLPHLSSELIYPITSSHAKRRSKPSINTLNTIRMHQNKVIMTNRLHTQPHKLQVPVPFQEQWQQTFNRRQNFLNSMFNRRKTVLESISKKNRDIYVRITNQESHYPICKILKEEHPNDIKSIENLTANSRMMLTLSRHALNNSNQLSKEKLKDKQNAIGMVEKFASKQLTPIQENIQTSSATANFKVIQSRYLKDQARPRKLMDVRFRNKSVGRKRLTDVYTNF